MCKITGGEGSTFLLLLFSFVKIASVEKSMAVKATQNYDVLSQAYGKRPYSKIIVFRFFLTKVHYFINNLNLIKLIKIKS